MEKIKLTGRFGDLSFYRMRGEYHGRTAGGPDAKKMWTAASLQAQRDYHTEFVTCSVLGKKFRALLSAEKACMDSQAYRKFTGALTRIKDCDYATARGKRTVGLGILSEKGREQLRCFEFNPEAGKKLKEIKAQVNREGEIVIRAGQCFRFPRHSDHAIVKAARLRFDFTTGKGERINYEELKLLSGEIDKEIHLKPETEPMGNTGTDVFLLHVSFYTALREPVAANTRNRLVILEAREVHGTEPTHEECSQQPIAEFMLEQLMLKRPGFVFRWVGKKPKSSLRQQVMGIEERLGRKLVARN